MTALFRDPGEGDEREDGYSQPHGFLLGGMLADERESIAFQYLKAANLIVDGVRQKQVADYEVAYPVLYLYRHAIEVLVKALIGGDKDHHRLDVLGCELVAHVRARYDQEVPRWVIEQLNEVASIDPTSQAFRYGEDKYSDCKAKQRRPIPYETYVRVEDLHKSMNRLYAALGRALAISRRSR